jgi:fucose permease
MRLAIIGGRAPVTTLSFVSMLFLGLGISLVGASARNAGIEPAQVGLLVTVQQLGFLASVAIAGSLADRRSKTLILATGAAIVGIGFYFFFFWNDFGLNLFFMFLIGAGIGCFEGVTDAMLVDAHRERASIFITFNHFFVVLGMFIITVYMLFLQLQWRMALVQGAVVLGVLAVAGVLVKDAPAAGSGGTDWAGIGRLLRNGTMVKLFLATACAVGLELGTVGILTSYLAELRGATSMTASLGLVAFLGAYGVGRAVIGPIVAQRDLKRWVTIFFAAATVGMLGVFIARPIWLVYALIVLSGLVITNLLPLLISISGKRFPDSPATAMGILKLGIPIGGVVIPFLLSAATQAFSLQVGLFVFPLTALIGFLVVTQIKPAGVSATAA